MFREIINAFRKRDVVKELSARIGEMLEVGQWMFDRATDVLMRRQDWHDVSDKLYEKDRLINEIEKDVRRQIVTHLSVAGARDLAPCLVMMSVVKDAERIGDYCKNIFEVGRFYTKPFEHPEFSEPLQEVRGTVLEMFAPTREAFVTGNQNAAEGVTRQIGALSGQCDMIVQQLLRIREGIPADEAVAYVLLARHYKRVARHLGNVAISVGSSVPLLDFHST